MSTEAERTYTIGELAQEFEVTPRTLRFYEAEELLSPERRGRHRVYGRRDRARLSLILRGRRLGFSVADIKEWLDLYDVDSRHVVQLRFALEKARQRMADLERQLEDISSTLTELCELEAVIVRQLEEKEGKTIQKEQGRNG